ncbi:MAG: T9SS type A sorting domain-containing protein [Flavobacteriia bacterium]|nr:T9SS type A sorting domain-containing protein [Flavobacteriia bacterium]
MIKKSTWKKLFITSLICGFSFLSFGQTVVFTNDFSNPADWTIGNNAGNTDNWVIGTAVPSGTYPIPGITSTTVANGFALFDSDLLCSLNQSAWITNANPIDLSATPNVILNFESMYRKWTGQIFVQISTDNTNWTDFEQNATYADNDMSDNPQIISIDISAAIASNPASTYIRFLYLSDASNGGDGCDYAWMVDDISLVTVPSIDASLSSMVNINEYSIFPIPQGDRVLNLESEVTNNGVSTITNYSVTTNIYLDPDFTTPIQTYNQNGSNLASGSSASVNFGTYTVSAAGTYWVESLVTTAGDANSTNDTLYSYIVMDPIEYARDLGNLNGTPLGMGLNSSAVLGQTFEINTPTVLDSVLYAVSPGVVGGTVTVRVSEVVAGVPSTTFIGQSQALDIDQNLVDFVTANNYAVIVTPVTDLNSNPLILAPGTYFVGVEESTDAENMGLRYSTGIITPGSQFASIDGAAFADLETFNFFQTVIVRPYLGTLTTVDITSNDTDNMACEGETIVLTSSVANGNQWHLNGLPLAGETNQTINVMTSGIYTSVVNSVISNEITITINPLPTVNAGTDNSICAGTSVSLNASGAVTYIWDNGVPNGGSFTPVSTATYSVIGTDANGCTDIDDLTITVNALPVVSIGNTSNPTTCGGSDGTIELIGNGTGTISWTGTSSGSVVETLPATGDIFTAGSYNITFVDGNGCTSNTVSASLADPGVTTPVITANGPTTFCEGGSVSISSDLGTDIIWSTGETTQTIEVSSSMVVSVTFSQGGCTASSNTVAVTENLNPIISIASTSNPTTCSGTDGSISINTTETGLFYWVGQNNGMVPSNGSPTVISGFSAGTYGFTLVSTANCNSNIIQTSFADPNTVTPIITPNGSTTFCEGGSVVLTSSSANNNTWSTGETTQSILVSQGDFYTVTTEENGCNASSLAINVVVNSNPSINLGTVSNPTSCGTSTGSIEITGSETGTLSWSGATNGSMNNVTLPQTISNLPTGAYSISFENGNMCSSNTVAVSLNDPGVTAPVITANGSTTFCNGGSVTLTSDIATGLTWSTGATTQSIDVSTSGSIYVNYTDGTCSATSNSIEVVVNQNPFTNLDAFTDPSTCSGADGSISIYTSESGILTWTNGSMNTIPAVNTISGLTAGTYTFEFTSSNNCPATSLDVTLTDPNATSPSITASGSTTFCEGGSVTLTSSMADSYLWSTGETTQSIVVSSSSNVDVTTMLSGCSATSSNTIITANPNPVINAGQDVSVCSGESVVLQGSGAFSYDWDNGVIDGQPFVPSATATYTVTGTDVNLCTGTDQVVITIMTGTINAGGDQTVCAGQSVTLTGSNGTNFIWNNGVQDGVAFVPTQTMTYTATGEATNGCTDTDDVLITVNPIPTVDAGDDVVACIGTQVTLTATGATVYQWTGGILNNTPFTVSDTMTYTVTGTLNGCTDSDDVTVFAEDCSGINEGQLTNLQLFPNPTSSFITLKADDLSSVKSVEVIDQIGRVIVSIETNSSNEVLIDLSTLSNGTYYVTLNGAGKSTLPIQVNK